MGATIHKIRTSKQALLPLHRRHAVCSYGHVTQDPKVLSTMHEAQVTIINLR